MRLKNRVAIVTGAGSGFGEAIARRYADEGAQVVVNDIAGDAAERVAREIGAKGGSAAAHVGDVSRDAQVAGLVQCALDRFGRLDCDPILGLVAIFDAKVEIEKLDVEIGVNQLVLDELPDDARHLVAIEFDDRVFDLDFRHGEDFL